MSERDIYRKGTKLGERVCGYVFGMRDIQFRKRVTGTRGGGF